MGSEYGCLDLWVYVGREEMLPATGEDRGLGIAIATGIGESQTGTQGAPGEGARGKEYMCNPNSFS